MQGERLVVGQGLLFGSGTVLVYAVVLVVGALTYPAFVFVFARPVLRETVATVQLFRQRRHRPLSVLPQQPVHDTA